MTKKTKEPPKEGAMEHQVPEPPPITRSISNNERGGPLKGCLV
jgi:hypothetical protein